MSIALTLPLTDAWGMHGDVGTGWMVLMMASMVLFWGAIALGIAWLIRGATRSWSGPSESRVSRETPVEILERRFAEGAISQEEYRARLDVLVAGADQPNGARRDEPLQVP